MSKKELFKELFEEINFTETDITEQIESMNMEYFYIYHRHLTTEEQNIFKELLKNKYIQALYKLAWEDGVDYGYA